MEIFVIFIGGGIGACLRYIFSLVANEKFNLAHWSTFFINILGCVLIGFVVGLVSKYPDVINHNAYLFLTTGIAGGFTTFSTFSLENINLLKEGKVFQSILYMNLSLFLGVISIFVGFKFAGIF